jgi:glutathione synthase/RimK-type ligase-like ATP-grasp enzyme
MSLRIAIQPDSVTHPNGERQSFSDRWIELAKTRRFDAVPVDVFAPDAMSRIAGCDAFMWRYASSACPRLFARRLLQAVEAGLAIPVFPSTRSAWFYEDKVGQDYFFRAAGIPHAATRIFWTRRDAERFCQNATYPFVLKLAGGHQSANVRLLATRAEALFYVDQLFGHGLVSLGYRVASRSRLLLRRLRAAADFARGRNPYASTRDAELQHGYFYAQEFLPGNAFEVSAIVIGNRACACRRFIRPGDFRTRGSSGVMDFDPAAIGEDAIRLAYRIARKLDAQTIAVDILRRGNEPVAIELTVNYASWVVRDCPGYWVLEGDPETGELGWVSGSMRAEDVILENFLEEIHHSARVPTHRAVTMPA